MADSKPKTKGEIAKAIESKTGIRASDVERVVDGLSDVILEDLSDGGPGSIVVAGLVKLEVAPTPARAERQGRNLRTGEPITIAAKPAMARGKIKATPRKALKDVL